MEHINLSYLNDLLDNNREIIADVLTLFKQEVPKDLDRLKQALSANDYEQLGKIAHKLKSSVGNLGLTALKDDFYFLEQSGKNNQNIEQMPDTVTSVITRLDEIFLEIDAEILKLRS